LLQICPKSNCKEWQIISFLFENYFNLESNEIISLDSIPFYNHATDSLQTSLIAVSPHHELIEGLRQSQMLWNLNLSGRRLTNNMVNMMLVEDGYIYQIK